MNADLLKKLEYLLVCFLDGNLQKDEIDFLERILINDSKAQDYYFEYLKTYQALRQARSLCLSDSADYQQILEEMGKYESSAKVMKQEEPQQIIEPIKNVKRPRAEIKVSKISVYTAVLSSAALLFLVLLVQIAPKRIMNDHLARIDKAIDAVWEYESDRISEGDWLKAGPKKLVSGCIEMQMVNGGCVIVEGPAEFTLESPNQIFLQQGRLTATVENQSTDTFVVRSPFGSVVDYGTEFGVNVKPTGVMETHVFRGKVQLRDSADFVRFNTSLFLNEGNGAASELSGGILRLSDRQVNTNQFVRSEELLIRHKAAQGSSYHRWLAYHYNILRDQSLVACYKCQQNALNPYKLTNSASTGDALSGTFGQPDRPDSKPAWTEGRWPQTMAIQFDRAKEQFICVPDNPKLRINGPITMAAWIKLYAWEDPQGGMILSSRTLNNINYQLVLGKRPSYEKMVLAFGRYDIHLDAKVHSDLVSLEGQTWHHIAVTHDNSMVNYYIDGKLVTAIPHVFKQEPVGADLYIGFTPVAESAGFHGILGELMIFNRVLTEQEIAGMYSQTKP